MMYLFLSVHLFIFLVSFLFLLYEVDGVVVGVLAFLFALVEISMWAFREKATKQINWCHPVPIFTLGYCIVYYQLPLCSLLGLEIPSFASYLLAAPATVSYCLNLAVMGLASFFIAEQLFLFNRQTLLNNNEKKMMHVLAFSNHVIQRSNKIRLINSLVLAAIIVIFYVNLKSLGGLQAFLGYAYGDIFGNYHYINATSTSYSSLALSVLTNFSILLEIVRLNEFKIYSMKDYLKKIDKRVLLIITITLVPSLLSGDRGTYLEPIIMLIAPYFFLVKPLSSRKAVILVLSAAFFLAAIGESRLQSNISLKESLQVKVGNITNPAEWPTTELALSGGTFNLAVEMFPSVYSYNYGLTTLYSISSILPFSSRLNLFGENPLGMDYVNSSTLFFTNLLTHGTFSSGAGTSSLADIYMDLGPAGVPIAMFLFGGLLGWVSRKAYNGQEIFIFVYCFYCYRGLYVNRSTFVFGLNILIWTICLYYIARFYLNTKNFRISQ